jgi:hypothetical protein
VNMIERVARALSDTAHNIDPTVFEECALALLSDAIGGLSPVPGGTDHGRDAEIVRSGETPIHVTVTSSRSNEGARANLRRSMRSMQAHGVAGDNVIAVSLALLNQTQRRSLEEMAIREGYKLLAVYDRSYFTARLASHGTWRQRLLGLPSGPYSLARVSDPDRPTLEQVSLVGRDEVVSEIRGATSDLIVWGVAGAGKTAVLESLDGLMFVQGSPPDDRLMDDLLDAEPERVAVDDAGARGELLARLRTLRGAEGLRFRIVAVCWPHEVTKVNTHLPGALPIEIGLLTRTQIAEVVLERGIRNRLVLQRILAQAMGRVGWATHLADLLKDERTRHSVFDGVALQSEVERFVIRAGLPSTTTPLLAVLGLIGRVGPEDLRQLAERLQVGRMDLSAQLDHLATGGLIEVDERVGYNGDSDKYFEVVPELLALSLAGTIFTKVAAPATAGELVEWIPSTRDEVIGRTIKCALMGVDAARPPARAFLRQMLATPTQRVPTDLLRHYALLGESEAHEVIEHLWRAPDPNGDDARQAFSRHPRADLLEVLEQLAEYRMSDFAAGTLMDVLLASEEANTDYQKGLESIVDAVRGFARLGHADTPRLIAFGVRAIRWFEESKTASRQAVLVRAVCELLKPSFEATTMSITQHRAVEFRTGWFACSEMRRVVSEIWGPFAGLGLSLTAAQGVELCDVVGEWARIALGHTMAHGAEPGPEERAAARKAVATLTSTIIPQLDASPGLRARLRHHARSIIDIPEADSFLAAVFDTRDPSENWRAWNSTREHAILESAPTDLAGPHEWCALLRSLKDEMVRSRQLQWVDAVALLLGHKIDLQSDAAGWVRELVEFDLIDEARTPIQDGLAAGLIPFDIAASCANNERFRPLLVTHGIRAGLDDPYAALALDSVRAEDAALVEIEVLRGDASEDFLLAMLSELSGEIRLAVAAAIVAGTREEVSPSSDVLAAVEPALRELSLPAPFRLHFESSFMSSLLRIAPDVYTEKLIEAAISYRRDHKWGALTAFERTAATMGREDRTRTWSKIPRDARGSRVFGALAGSDLEWVRDMLRDGDVDTGIVLNAVGNDDTIPLADLAKLLIPYGVQPLRVAQTVEYGTRFGEEHERLAQHLDRLRELADSPDPELRQVGVAGVEFFEPQYRAAVRQAHRNEVTGKF